MNAHPDDQPDETPFDFYTWVLPDSAFLYGVYTTFDPARPNPKRPDGRWVNHIVFDTHAELARWANGRAENTEATYFALSSYLQNGAPRKNKWGTEFRTADRTQKNVAAIKSLWVDIDCGPQKQYTTKPEAIAAVNELVEKGYIPFPSIIVDSGNGYHLYWCMTAPILPSEWAKYADCFRTHLVSIGLRFDVGVTIDSARILRCPGTMNCKDPSNPKDVQVQEISDLYNWSDILRSFGATASSEATGAPKGTAPLGSATLPASVLARVAAGDNDLDSLTGSAGQSYFFEHIVPECAQLSTMQTNGGADCSEPLWKSMLLLAARCEDGDEWAHKLSEGHPDYTPAHTDTKLAEQRMKLSAGVAGPSRCSAFFAERPEICLGCPHNVLRLADKPGVPLVFGKLTLATGATYPSGFVELPDNTMQRTIQEKQDDGTYAQTKLVFAPFAIRDMILTREQQEAVYQMTVVRRGQKPRRVNISASQTRASPLLALSVLAKVGIDLKRQEDALHMMAFLRSYAEELDEAAMAVTDLKQVGFVDDTFRLGATEVSARGTVHKPSMVRLDTGDSLTPKGSYDAWRKAAVAMEGASPQLQSIVALSFGAPLAKLVELKGFAFSFHSKASGVGKSTAIRLGASVYGSPESMVSSLNDTEKAVAAKIGMYPNLPAYWDEVRATGDDKELGRRIETIFSLVQGRERTRLRADTSMREGKSWNTLMGIGTNERLLDLMSTNTDVRDPLFARMLEISMPGGVDTSASASAPFTLVENNYGHAGARYMAAVLSDRKSVADNIIRLADKLAATTGLVGGTYRFWHPSCALLIVGAALARKAGILDFDVSAITNMLVNSMVAAASGQQTVMKDISNVLGKFMDWFHAQPQSWLITENGQIRMNPDPRLGAVYHVDVGTGIVLMRMQAFERKAREMKMPVVSTLEALLPAVQVVDTPFAPGTPYGSPAPRRCLRFDMRQTGAFTAIDAYLREPLAVANGGRLTVSG